MLSKPTAVTSLEYYRDQDKQSRRENLMYYTDNETIDRGHSDFGEWLTIAEPGADPLAAGIVDGGRVDWKTIDALSQGIDPATGKRFATLPDGNKEKSVAAQDLTFSASKDFSYVHAMGRMGAFFGGPHAELFQKIADITKTGHELGVRDGIRLGLQDAGAFEVRYGSAGRQREKAQYMAAAMFTHYTSRDGDMQLHTHVVVPNVARGPDGSVRRWDNYGVNSLIGRASAVYRATAFAYVKEEMEKLGIKVHVSKDGRNLKFDGIPEAVPQHFSKRRTAVLKKMMEDYGTDDTKNNRKLAQYASYATRRDKAELPPIQELYSRWNFETNALGTSIEEILENIHTTAVKAEVVKDEEWTKTRTEAAKDGVQLPEQRPDQDLQLVAQNAIKNITALEATFERRKFETTVLEELQASCNGSTALALVEQVKAENEYVKVGVKGRAKEAVLTDKATLMREYEFMDLETSLRGNVPAIDPKFIRQAIAEGVEKTDGSGERFQLNKEQEGLVWHLLSGSQRTDGIGDAGTGKTTTMVVVRRACELAGLEVHLTAPTNKAVTGLAKELGIPIERGYSVSRFILDYEKGKLQLGPESYVILDEAGMVSGADFLKLDRIAAATGCRIAAVGDPKQLPPVAAGAPFRMTTEAFGAGRLLEIARQKEAWARQASKDLASGNVQDGMMAYVDRGHMHFLESAEAVHEKALKTVMEFEEQKAGETLLISPTNAERRSLSRRLIEMKIEAGILKGDQYTYDHYDRGTDAVQTSVIMIGSTLALAENVTYRGERFPNNAIGLVTNIEPDGEFEPDVTVKWEDGREITFKPSAFVGFRESDDKNAGIPRLAPADCLTLYQAQGLSIPNVVAPFTTATTTQAAYVSLTRHKANFVGIVDAGRIEADLSAKGGKVFTMGKDGSTRQEDDVPETEVTQAEIVKRFIEEAQRTNSKANACDLLGGAKSFHEKYRADYEAGFSLRQDLTQPQPQKEAAKADAVKTADMTREGTMQKPEDANNQDQQTTENKAEWRKSRVRGLGMTGGQLAAQRAAKAEADMEAIIERRMNAPMKPETTLKKPTEATRTTTAQATARTAKYEAAPRWDYYGLRWKEVEYLGAINLIDYARNNYSLKMGKREVIKDMGECQWLIEPNGAQISFGQTAEGKWTFARRDRAAKGSIFKFVENMDSISPEAAVQKLQDQYRVELEAVRGQPRSSSNFRKSDAPKRALTFKEKLMEARAVVWPKQAFAAIVARYERMKSGVNDYLLNRGISIETQDKFKGQIRTESAMSPVNPLGVAFPVCDADGVQTTFDRKGPKKAPQDERSFSAMAGDGREQGDPEKVGVKRLPMLGELQNPERIYITEQLIDTLSLYQLDKKAAQEGRGEQVPERVLLLATAGNPSDAALSDIAQIAERNPNTPIHVGMDDDAAGRSLGAVINDAVKVGRGDEAQTVERKLEPGFKDFNAQLMQHRTVEEIEANWSKAQIGSSGYLAKEEISRETQHQFKDDIRLEGEKGIDGQNVRGVMIAMRDENGVQTGYMRYGVEREPTTAREFRRPHTAQENDLVRIGQQQNAQTILVGHSAIDVLKVYEQQGRPEGALLIAAEGGFNDRQKAAFAQIVKANPSATFHVIPDATVDYSENAQKAVDQTHVAMMESITETNPYAKVQEAAAPAPQGQYWRALDEQMAAEAASRPEAPALDQQQPANAQQPENAPQAPAQADDRGPDAKAAEKDEKPSQQDDNAAEVAAARQEAEAAQRAAEISEKRAEVQQNRDDAQKREDPEQGYSM